MKEVCHECGGEAVVVRTPRYVPVGLREALVEVERMRCSQCGEEYFLPGQMDRAQQAAADQVRREEGLLTPDEIVELRRLLDVTQQELEALIGAGPKTVTRWERGTVAQNATADTLLRLLRARPELARDLAEIRGVAGRAGARARA